MESRSVPTASTTTPPLEAELDLSVLELMDAIAARHPTASRPPNSFTRKDFASRYDFTISQAISILTAEVESGNLQCKLAPRIDGNGGQELVYWEATGE